jgi:serine/threonine protein kinase
MKKKEENNYKKIGVLHKGANDSSVYLAIDSKKNILTAIKSIPKNKMDQEAQKNFRRELQNLHNLKHPNIIHILDYLNNQSYNYIVLEYCNGGNLREYLQKYMEKNNAPLNEFFIQKILRQIAPALEFMHSKNIIHRDIKLENILLNFNTYPNIPKNGKRPQALKFSEKSLNKDFSAKITGLNFSKDLIQDNMGSTILGTPLYMSPDVVERLDNKTNKKYNTSADLWSLGVITYELLTGTTPFVGSKYEEVFQNIEKGSYKLPKKLKPSIEIISFINGLLQYYPEKRYDWEQIKQHPFLTKNVEDFNFVDLELYSDGEKKEVEINSKSGDKDNLLWIFFKLKGLEGVKVDKINQKEKESLPKIDKKKVINEEVRKATQQEKIEKELEKQKIKKMKEEAIENKKKAELEKQKYQKEQEKLIKEENEINSKREKLIQENEKNKKGSEENTKKTNELKELEKKLETIKKEKENMGQQLQKIEINIAETEKHKKFTEKKIKEMTKINDNNINDEKFKKELKKLNEEKNNKFNEVEKLKKEEEIKQKQFIKEKEELEIKKNVISEEKKKLENEVNKNNEVKSKINDTDKQLQNLEDELKQKEQEKEIELQKIKDATEELKKQINEYNKIIEEKQKEKEKKEEEKQEEEKKEEEEKEGEKKIFGSFIQFEKEEIEKEMNDEWEKISEKDVNFEDDEEIDIDQLCGEYEIVENYVDTEIAKNEGK